MPVKGGQGRSYFYIIVTDCVESFKHFEDVLIQFVHRSVNGDARLLAKTTHFMSHVQEWIDSAHAFMSLIFDSI